MSFAHKPKHSKTWRIYWYDHGKLRSTSAKTRIESIARKKAKEDTAKRQLNLNDDNLVSPYDPRLKLSAAMDLFISTNDFTDKTIRQYRDIVLKDFISVVGDKAVNTYNNMDYLKWVKSLNAVRILKRGKKETKINLSKNTKANYTRHLNRFFNWLLKNELIKKNFIEKIKPEKKEVRPIPLNLLPDLWNKMKEYNDSNNHLYKKSSLKYYELFKILFLGAYRANELINAQVEDYDFNSGKYGIVHIRNSKGKRTDVIPMPKDLRDHLLQLKLPEKGRITYLSYDGLHSFWERFQNYLNKNLNEKKYDYTIHQFRKSRGTYLANHKLSPLFLQMFMRHKNIATTMEYYVLIDIEKVGEEINSILENQLGKFDIEFDIDSKQI